MTVKKTNNIDVFVGSRIRFHRNILKLSQGTLGERLGVSFQQIQKYEKGTTRVSASNLQKISDALSVPIAFFFQQRDADLVDALAVSSLEGTDLLLNFLGSREGLSLNKAFNRITNAKVRQKIIALTKVLAQSGQDDAVEAHHMPEINGRLVR